MSAPIPPGLPRRRQELEAAKAKVGRQFLRTPDTPMGQRDLSELRRASNALQRQEDEYRRRLARDVGQRLRHSSLPPQGSRH